MRKESIDELLESTEDKLSIVSNLDMLQKKYGITKLNELFDIISKHLSDEEKFELFSYKVFKKANSEAKTGMINLISDENLKLKIFNDDSIMDGITPDRIFKLVGNLSDKTELEILTNEEFAKNKLHLSRWDIVELAKNLNDDASKETFMNSLELNEFELIKVMNTCSNSNDMKLKKVLEGQLENNAIKTIIGSLEASSIIDFFNNNKDFYEQKELSPYEITMYLESQKQLELANQLGNIDLALDEKRKILATLKSEAKENIDTTNWPKEYKTAIDMEAHLGKIEIDFNKDLEEYRGLDDFIIAYPEKYTPHEREKVLELCDICPGMIISNIIEDIALYSNTAEYKEAEKWISSVLDNLDPEYSKVQKIAVIENAIGKKISYSPDFGKEIFRDSDARTLWRIVNSGYGVCNGISAVMKYMLDRVGIESEIVGTATHAFLKLPNIELPLENGEIVNGTTIVDPTWDLIANRFGARPDNFCISYEQARKNDIDENKKDHYSHRNDEELQDAQLNLDERSLRAIFKSVGLTREDGKFPITDLMEESDALHEKYSDNQEKDIISQFDLLSKTYPEFATCQDSTMKMLSDFLLDKDKIAYNKCIVNKVYEKSDENRRPVLFAYIDSNEFGKKFFYADRAESKFLELDQETFLERFECYDVDLEKNNGLKLWETEKSDEINLATTSGTIIKGDGQR